MLARIAKNTTYLTLSGGIAAALAVINMPQIVAAIGLEDFGRIVVMQAIAATVATIVMPQTWQSIMKFSRRDRSGVVVDLSSPLFAFGYLIEIFGGGVAITISASILFVFLDAAYQTHALGLMLVACAAVVSNSTVSDTVLRERGMFGVIAAAQVFCQGFKVLALLFMLVAGQADFLRVCMVIFVTDMTRLATVTWIARRGLAPIRFIDLLRQRPISKPFISSVLWINVSDIVDLPVRHLDKILTSLMLGPSAAGIFAIFKRLSGVFGIVADAMYQATYPVLAQLVAEDHAKAVALAKRVGSTFFVAGIAPLIALIMYSSLWVPLVIPALDVDVRLEVGVLLTATFMAMCFIMVHPLYILYGHERHNASVTCVVNAVYLGALWLLSMTFGLLGAVIACAVQYFLIIGIKVVHLHVWTFPVHEKANRQA